MTYDFDTPIDRSGTYSLKWEEAGDALPMWVADMDFQTCLLYTSDAADE